MANSLITRREALHLGAGTLLSLGLWPGCATEGGHSGSFRFVVVNDTHYTGWMITSGIWTNRSRRWFSPTFPWERLGAAVPRMPTTCSNGCSPTISRRFSRDTSTALPSASCGPPPSPPTGVARSNGATTTARRRKATSSAKQARAGSAGPSWNTKGPEHPRASEAVAPHLLGGTARATRHAGELGESRRTPGGPRRNFCFDRRAVSQWHSATELLL